MLDVVKGKSTVGLPYELLLTRVFEWFGVSFEGVESVQAKEFLDVKCLSQSNLKVEKDGTISVIEVPVPPPPLTVGSSSTAVVSKALIIAFMEEMRDNHKS